MGAREVVKGPDIQKRDASVAGKGKKGEFWTCPNLYLRGMSYEDAAAICEEDIEQVKAWYVQWGK